MGMYDIVRIKVPLPNGIVHDGDFQTKDLENLMDEYTITEDGRLVKHTTRKEMVPEEERPYYDKPEWDEKPFLRFAGSIRSIPTGDVDTNYHGDLSLVGDFGDYTYLRFVARFTHGQLEYIHFVEEL